MAFISHTHNSAVAFPLPQNMQCCFTFLHFFPTENPQPLLYTENSNSPFKTQCKLNFSQLVPKLSHQNKFLPRCVPRESIYLYVCMCACVVCVCVCVPFLICIVIIYLQCHLHCGFLYFWKAEKKTICWLYADYFTLNIYSLQCTFYMLLLILTTTL